MWKSHFMLSMPFMLSMAGAGCDAPRSADAKPGPDPRVRQLEDELAESLRSLDAERAAGDALRRSESELKAMAQAVEALQKKLSGVVGEFGDVTTEDGAVRLELVDKILFPVGEASLTPRGREVLAKVGAALKDIEDKQIWVQGHTDDSPIVVHKPKAEDPKAKPIKADGKAKQPAEPPATSDAVLPFITNWELSAARALTVVHYLQDEAKLDPTRLAAVAFGEYRPSSRSRAKNRRIEIVLYPRAKISPK
jgi:chemotaxis protein MotB